LGVTPADGSTITAGQTITATVNYEQGLGASFFRFQVNGGSPIDVPAGATSASATFSAPVNATQVIINMSASDNAAFDRPLALTPVTLQAHAPVNPPQLLTVSPPNSALRQSLWSTSVFDFDRALNPATISGNITLATQPTVAAPAPFSATLANAGQELVMAPARPLAPGTTYTTTLLPGIKDLVGNAWRNIGGAVVPPEGDGFSFTTAAILGTTPASGQTVLGGRKVATTVNYEPGLGAQFFRFLLNGAQAAQVPAGATRASATLTMPINDPQAIITILAANEPTFAEPLTLTPITVNLVPLGPDTDGDGMPDGYELSNGLDPARNDAGEDPDGDGLTNLDEFQLGTDPHNADTDFDGLNDGDEIARGTDPLNVDSDGDHWPDGFEVEAGSDPLDAASIPSLFVVSAPETRLVLSEPPVLGVDNTAVVFSQPTAGLQLSVPPNIDVEALSVTFSEPVVRLQLSVAPTLDISTLGVTLSQPVAGLILPIPSELNQDLTGVTLSQPVVGLVLAAPPELAGDLTGVTLSQPVVTIELDADLTGTFAGGAEIVSARAVASPALTSSVRLLRIRLLLSSPVPSSSQGTVDRSVLLEWQGPAAASYVIESSPDLRAWEIEKPEVLEAASSNIVARLPGRNSSVRFYRIRLKP
jgi:hypothetical protein